MKKCIGLIIIFLIAFFTCANPDNTDNTDTLLDVIPQFAFQTSSINPGIMAPSKAIVPDGTGRSNTIYYIVAPLFTGFDMDNPNKLKISDNIKVTILDTKLDIAVTKNGEKLTFAGTLEDGSGVITLEYDRAAKTFTYEQIIRRW